METRTKIMVGVIVVVALLGAVLLMHGKSPASETGPITIGFIAPLTGDVASLGAAAKAAAEMAVAEVNANGGVDGRKLNVIYEDGQCSATPASNAANKLMNVDRVTAI